MILTVMHPGEIATTVPLVEGLVASQFPQWAGRAVAPVASGGTDNAIYRLGDDLSVRLPRMERATGQVGLERRWLPALAPRLPAEIPEVLAVGRPALGYPFSWGVYRWIAGDNPQSPAGLGEPLAAFLTALRAIDPGDGPRAVPGGRGASLRGRDIGEWIPQLADDYDPAVLTGVYEADRSAPEHDGPPVWLHGDLHAGNLLVRDGTLAAVLDWSCLTVGDPAADLIPAWLLLDEAERGAFREALEAGQDMWRRGRAWAFGMAIAALAYYRDTNPYFAALGRFGIGAVLSETGRAGPGSRPSL